MVVIISEQVFTSQMLFINTVRNVRKFQNLIAGLEMVRTEWDGKERRRGEPYDGIQDIKDDVKEIKDDVKLLRGSVEGKNGLRVQVALNTQFRKKQEDKSKRNYKTFILFFLAIVNGLIAIGIAVF